VRLLIRIPIEPWKSERGLRRSVLYYAFAVDDTMLKWLSKEVRRQRQMVELTAATSAEFWDLAIVESQPFFDELLAALLPPDGSLTWSAELRVAKQEKIAAFLKQKTGLELRLWGPEEPDTYVARTAVSRWIADRPSVDLRYYGKHAAKYNWIVIEDPHDGFVFRPSPELKFIRFDNMRNRPLRNPPLP
jgi:hypothetical protein